MKLIQCPNCGTRIVEIDEVCPNCYKVAEAEYINYFNEDKLKRKWIKRLASMITIVILFIVFAIIVTINVFI